jgi:hypothetical protein
MLWVEAGLLHGVSLLCDSQCSLFELLVDVSHMTAGWGWQQGSAAVGAAVLAAAVVM